MYFWWWEAESERPWEAVWGRAPLIGLEICPSQSGEHGLTRPLTASHFRPLITSASHNLSCDLSEPIRREHGLSRTRPHGLTDLRVRSASHAHRRCCHHRGRLTDFTAKRIASAGRVDRPVCVRGRSDSQICEAVCRPCSPQSHVICLRSEASHGLTDRTHRSDSQIRPWESDLWGRESPSPILGAIWLTAKRIASPGLPHGLSLRTLRQITRPHRSASQIGLSDRSDSLTDLTD